MNGRTRGGAVGMPRAVLVAWAGLLLVAVGAGPTGLHGQTGPRRLTLEEAVAMAMRNNPTYLSMENDRGVAAWYERAAYGAFLPGVEASASAGWTEAGTQRIGTLDFGAQGTDWYSSSYNLGLTWTLSGRTIFGVPNARASRRATDARVDAAAFDLESQVAFQYMVALRARDQVEVARRQLERARQNQRIVQTRLAAGSVAGTDGKQAEVETGRAEVAVIQAERDLRQARLLLAERIGVALPPDVELVSEFQVFEPALDTEELIGSALGEHPSIQAYRAQESASRAAARQTATSQYLPTITVTTGLRGNTLQALNEAFLIDSEASSLQNRRESCELQNAISQGLSQPLPGYPQDCSRFVLDDARRQALIDSNDVFPFRFTKLPLSVGLSVSVPIFTGFSRQQEVSAARAAADDAEHERRAEELRLRTAVTSAADDLESAYRVLRTEERNRALAEEQLELQQRRYALGAVGLLELLDAQATVSTADQAYLKALYDFHYSLIALEAATGRPLAGR